MAEPNKYLEQMTAQERLDLGRSYYEDGRFDEAIKALSNIRREEVDPETYAQAQLGLGAAYYAQEDWEQAIKTWSKVRSDENSEAYAKAQLNLGVAYQGSSKLEQAITAWSNIHRDDDREIYAEAQFRLGFTYLTQDRLGDAITAWSNIRRDDDREIYANAQLSLGVAYQGSSKLEQAITAWSNIHRDDDREIYARAQLSLGIAYYIQNKPGETIKAWSSIRRDDDREIYAEAQFRLGFTYQTQDRLGDAITAWSNIHRNDSREIYANAQLSLGAAYHVQNKLEQAIQIWSNIQHKDDHDAYAKAQMGLGRIYYAQNKLEQAITAWSNIHRDDDREFYARAQYGLGKIYENKGNIKQAKEAYRNARDFLYYEGEREYRILTCPQEVIEKLRGITKNTNEVLNSLQIIPEFESRVAHYSRALTAFNLFGDEKNNKNPSNFRLSTIRGVNDPTEGLVLSDYWDQQGIPETIHTNDTATFISCFTFNHDSLNQFRLYGKENGREATGVSLVFKKEFFSEHSDVLKHIVGGSSDPSNKSGENESDEAGKPENDNKKLLIGKSTLYRCIYLDPETGYWTLAQRDKSTFYRKNEDKETAENNWEKYSTEISKIEESVKKHLFDSDDSALSILKSIFKNINIYNAEEKQKILEALRFILLPLQYLVKHIAFREEQECRIMYTTHLHDEKIRHNWEKQWMYVEYKEQVLPHIDKIYLSPGSAKYQDFFRILLDQKEDNNKSKVRISQNPFRNKE